MSQILMTRPTTIDRLSDLDDVVSSLVAEFPSKRGLPLATETHHLRTLPAQPTKLINRVEELDTARRLLNEDGIRLLTLTGPAGTGKTRLALAAAEAVRDGFPEGVWFVDLAPLADPSGLLPMVAALLGVCEPSDWAPAERLCRHLEGRRVLLVLDNCEHLLPALALDVADLLGACPGVTVLATSREPLRLRWEHRLPVPPLGLPHPRDDRYPEMLMMAPAVALFVERAEAVCPFFELTEENGPAVAELCRRLDGLPLAIELAAAHTNALSPSTLLARLERHLPLPGAWAGDVPERHQTLDAAIGWGDDLLSPHERALFRRLSVFTGSWTLAAAEAIGGPCPDGIQETATRSAADAESHPLDTLHVLLPLVDKSLIRSLGHEDGELRFEMLQTVREIALKQLEAAGELEETRARLAAYCAQRDHVTPLRAAPAAGSTGRPAPERDARSSNRDPGNPLSERERAVLRLVAQGLPSKQIGRELALAERTVKAHVTGAMNKLGAFTRAQALGIAVEHGLL
jgi:predicted ATPase